MDLEPQRITLLILLDLSAAFVTVDHGVLLNHLSMSFGVRGSVLQWFTTYLLNRSQHVSFDQNLSKKFNLQCGIPQESCLGPLLFTIYASKSPLKKAMEFWNLYDRDCHRNPRSRR